MPKRTFWLVAGVAIGASSSMWAERRVRRTLEEAAARLQPDALVVTATRSARQAATVAGRSARAGARTAGERLRHAAVEGRSEMQRHEEQLWSDLDSTRVAAAPRVGAGR